MFLSTGKIGKPMTAKTFETTEEAQELCKPDRQLCNPKFGQERNRWRNCLKLRLSLCSYHSYAEVPGLKKAAYISYCTNPEIPSEFCLGRQCKALPAIVIEDEQKVTFHFGASAPKVVDYKMRSAGEKEEVQI